PVDLDDPAPWQATHAEGHVKGDRAGRDHRHRDHRPLAHAHYRALAELLIDLREGKIECLLAVGRCCSHRCHPYVRGFCRCLGRGTLGHADTLGAGSDRKQPTGRGLWISTMLWTIPVQVYDAWRDTPRSADCLRYPVRIGGHDRAPDHDGLLPRGQGLLDG